MIKRWPLASDSLQVLRIQIYLIAVKSTFIENSDRISCIEHFRTVKKGLDKN